MSDQTTDKEERLLRMMKRVLTDIAKDTHVSPGLKHPLSAQTVQGIRECLSVITSREQELAKAAGRDMNMRPHYIDEPKTSAEVVVEFDAMKKGLKKNGD